MADIEAYAEQLADSIEEHFVGWLERCVFETTEKQGLPVTGEMKASTARMSAAMKEHYLPEVRTLLMTDVDEQRTTPMAVLRGATIGATQVLAEYEVPAVDRDDYEAQQFPEDYYALVPYTFADIHPDLAEPGLSWGAAKAFVHKERHRS